MEFTSVNGSYTLEITMAENFKKMRGIPDSVLGPALRNHTDVLQNVIAWIGVQERAQRRRDRIAVGFALVVLVFMVWVVAS